MIRKFLAKRDGMTAVEFGICAPIVFGFLFALIDLGRYAMIADSIESGVFDAARQAMVRSTDSASPISVTQLEDIVKDSAIAARDDVTVSITYTGGNTAGATVEVSASYEFKFITPLINLPALQTIRRSQEFTIVN